MIKLEKYCRKYGRVERVIVTNRITHETLSDSILYYPNKTDDSAFCRDIKGTNYIEAGKLINSKKWYIRNDYQYTQQGITVYEFMVTIRRSRHNK